MRAGLIPSRALQEQRIVHEREKRDGEQEERNGEFFCSLPHFHDSFLLVSH